MKALVVAPQPFFTPRGTPFSVYYRTLILSELGVEVDLLTYGRGADVDLPNVRTIRIPRFGFLGPVKVGPSGLKLFLDGFLVLWALALLIRRRYDFVHAHEESVFFLTPLKRLFRYKLVYDMHSSLPEQLVNFRFTRMRWLIRLFEKLENSALRRADAVITICPELAEYATARMPDPSRHFLIENSLFEPVRLKEQPGHGSAGGGPAGFEWPQGRPVVFYAGTFEPYQGVDLLLRAFALARKRIPGALLVLAGGTPEQIEAARKTARESGAGDAVVFTGRVPPETARAWTRMASLLTSPRLHGNNTPLKIYEQLASGVPLAATRIHSHTQVLDERVAFLADPEPEAFAQAIVEGLTAEERRREVARAAQELYREKYSREAYVAKMKGLLEVITSCAE